MSMFENPRFRWRETYFVLFARQHRPAADVVQSALARLDPDFRIDAVRLDDRGELESLTLLAPGAYSALDICYLEGEDVVEQVRELQQELMHSTLAKEDHERLRTLAGCDARFDVLHFEEVCDEQGEEVDEMFDPGALILVLQELCRLTQGVAVDPASATFVT